MIRKQQSRLDLGGGGDVSTADASIVTYRQLVSGGQDHLRRPLPLPS